METVGQEKREEAGKMIGSDSAWFDEMVAAARVVYLWHNGRNHREIERKMRELGWKEFNRNFLYRPKRQSGARMSWPERFGWDVQVARARRVP